MTLEWPLDLHPVAQSFYLHTLTAAPTVAGPVLGRAGARWVAELTVEPTMGRLPWLEALLTRQRAGAVELLLPDYTVPGYRSEDGDLEVARSLDLPFTNSPYMAQRIARIVLESNRRQISVDFPANLSGLRFAAGQTVAVSLPRFGLVDQPMVVSSWMMAETMGVDITLTEDDPAIYEFAVGDLVVTDAAPALSLSANADIPPATPTGLTATASSSGVLLTWSQQAESDFDHFEVWEALSGVSDPTLGSCLAETWRADWLRTGLAAGAARVWWVRAVDHHGNRSGFSVPVPLTVPGTPSYALILG